MGRPVALSNPDGGDCWWRELMALDLVEEFS